MRLSGLPNAGEMTMLLDTRPDASNDWR